MGDPTNPTATDQIWHFNSTQFPFKLHHSNYPVWKSSVTSLLASHSLLHFVDGSKEAPTLPAAGTGTSTAAQLVAVQKWQTQDHAIKHALMTSITETVVPYITEAATAADIWNSLHTIFSHKSKSRILNLKEQLQHAKQGSQSITEYLYSLKTVADTLTGIGKKVDDEDFTLFTINGLNPEFKDIANLIRNSEDEIKFDTLLSRLKNHEEHLHRASTSPTVVTANYAKTGNTAADLWKSASARPPAPPSTAFSPHPPATPVGPYFYSLTSTNSYPQPNIWAPAGPVMGYNNHPKPAQQARQAQQNHSNGDGKWGKKKKYVRCQYCSEKGHYALQCPKLPTAAPAANVGTTGQQDWLLDSGASNHVTNNLQNLTGATDYAGTDSLVIGNGNGLRITHVGTTSITNKTASLNLPQTLYVPTVNNNLLSVAKLCKDNNVLIEFHPLFCLVKDRSTGEVLFRGTNEGDVYCLPKSPAPVLNVANKSSVPIWHCRLGQPAHPITRHVMNILKIPNKNTNSSLCVSCSCSKSHKLPFMKSTLTSSQPLDIVYTDVWGPSKSTSQEGYRLCHFCRSLFQVHMVLPY